MANTLYNKARERFLTAQLNWSSDTIKAILVDAAVYTLDVSHQYLNQLTEGARVATAVTLGSKTYADGCADAADSTFAQVSGPSIEAIVIYKEVLDINNAVDETASPLIAYIDTATGLPITPNGGDIIVTWDNGTNRIFRL